MAGPFRKEGDLVGVAWLNDAVARTLLRVKLTLPILIALRQGGVLSTTRLIRVVRGHPSSVIRTLRLLEQIGVVARKNTSVGRHAVEARLTVIGLELVETPLCHWSSLIRKWNRLSG